MGKPKKASLVSAKNVSLEQQITAGKISKNKHRNKVYLRAEESPVLDNKITQKILSAAKKQQLELSEEQFPALFEKNERNWDNELNDAANKDVTENDFADDIAIEDEDAEAFERFQNPQDGKRTIKLADIILEKIKEKQTELDTKFTDVGSLNLEDIDKRVRELYEGVRDVLKRYRSGKVPKAFKIIPRLRNWEQILFITEPQNWSAAAMFQATRIFSSGLTQNMAQRFYNLVLLPRIRDDLCEYKKLNMHLYNALKRALYKPSAFMKGIILPLLEAGDCSLRESIIFGSIIARSSIPVLHSSACLLKICEMGYTGACSIFIRFFLEKRYALPYRVVDAAVFHFLRFEHDKRDLPILWHQSLLTFVQRYKNDISSEQKEALMQLLRKKFNPKITPAIRRELQAASCRDMEIIPHNDESKIAFTPLHVCTNEDMGD